MLMNYLADLHIHSHYAMATSKDLVPEHVDLWGRIKGITVVGTGDFTHPGWTEELKEKIEPAEPGLFRLKPEWRLDAGPRHDKTADGHIRFMLTSEISTIYKKGDKTRKVHHVILSPDFETVEKVQYKLGQLGNITSMAARSWGWILDICWRSSWRPMRTTSLFPPTSGRPGSRPWGTSRASIPSTSATVTWPNTSTPWKRASPVIRP